MRLLRACVTKKPEEGDRGRGASGKDVLATPPLLQLLPLRLARARSRASCRRRLMTEPPARGGPSLFPCVPGQGAWRSARRRPRKAENDGGQEQRYRRRRLRRPFHRLLHLFRPQEEERPQLQEPVAGT